MVMGVAARTPSQDRDLNSQNALWYCPARNCCVPAVWRLSIACIKLRSRLATSHIGARRSTFSSTAIACEYCAQ